MTRVPLRAGDARYTRIRRALIDRPRSRLELVAPATLPRSSAAAAFWSQRAWSEYAAVPAMAQTSLAVVRASGPLDALHVLASIGADEVRHTEISRDLAERFGGYDPEIPEGSAFRPREVAEPYDLPIAYWALSNGCISETLSLELMRARLPFITQPAIRRIVSAILRDEAIHARLSWLLASELVPALSPLDREELAEYARDAWAVMERSFVTRGMPLEDRRRERRTRNQVAKEGLGAAPSEHEDRCFLRVRDELVAPRLRRLGLPL